MVWLQFVVCLATIVVAGTRLSKYGDVIAGKTGLGRVWVGIVLLATVTSLPEVATGISAVAIVDSPDLAVGDLFGACHRTSYIQPCTGKDGFGATERMMPWFYLSNRLVEPGGFEPPTFAMRTQRSPE
jgi:hypothetical protein